MLTTFFHPRLGGVEKHVLGLAKELTRHGHELSVFTLRYDPALPSKETFEQINIFRFPQGAGPFTRTARAWLWMLGRLPALLRADAIHVHDHSAFIAWYLPFRFLLFWKPVYATFHGHEGIFPVVKRHWLARKLTEKLVKKNLCAGHYLEKWYGTQSDGITYGAVTRRDKEPPPEKDAIVFIGRLEPDTGILDYLEAFSSIQAQSEGSFSLYIYGDGSLKEQIGNIIASRHLNAELRGTVADPLPQIERCRFAFAAGYLSMLEAMSCRRLIFTVFDNPLKQDYLEMIPGAQNMIMIAGSPDILARQFFEILAMPDREKIMITAAWHFSQQYTWERLARDYLSL